MIITIGGPPGAGTTTNAKLISKEFDLKHIYVGMIFRELAKEKKMSLEEFSRYAERNEKVDKKVDERQVALAQDKTLVEGRISAFLIKADLKIWLDAPLEVRVKRLALREKKSFEEMLELTQMREESEKKRYEKFYQINLKDLSIYDLVINTSKWNIQGVYSIIKRAILNLR
ncbi:MAG: (d)CMP kinase [Candidatus Methanofastidiosia archaeon]